MSDIFTHIGPNARGLESTLRFAQEFFFAEDFRGDINVAIRVADIVAARAVPAADPHDGHSLAFTLRCGESGELKFLTRAQTNWFMRRLQLGETP